MFTVLVVEDDCELRQLYSRVLSQNGYFAREAENGKAALDALEQEYVDLIISDIMMPVMDGYELGALPAGCKYSSPRPYDYSERCF